MIAIAVVVSTLAAFAYSMAQAPQYEATAELVYVQPIDPTNPLGPIYSSTTQDLALQSAVYAVETQAILDRVDELLDESVSAYEITAAISGVSSTDDDKTGFVTLSVTGPDADKAAAVANAYAQAIVEWRETQVLDRVRAAEAAVQAQLDTYISPASRGTSDYVALKQNLERLRLLEKAVTPDVQVVAPAIPPSDPFAPQPWRAAVLGFGLGLLVGLALALLFDQLGVHRPIQQAHHEAEDAGSGGVQRYVTVAPGVASSKGSRRRGQREETQIGGDDGEGAKTDGEDDRLLADEASAARGTGDPQT